MTRLVPRLLGDVGDWFDVPALWPRSSLFRVEEYQEGDDYVIRAEMPGLDPDKDVTVSVSGGVLEISAQRREEKAGRRHSEFHYGTMHRSVTLPAGTVEDKISARYDKGVLEIRIPVAEPATAGRTIAVESGSQ